MAASGGDWGIAGVAPRSHDVLDALVDQDYLYSVVTLGGTSAGTQVVSAFCDAVHGSDPAAVIKLLADPAVRVVTLTVTEKAYTQESPIMRLLVAGLRVRCGAPITVLSCDNLPSNGEVLSSVVLGLAPELSYVTFPSCMVDRIVPATTQATLDRAQLELGCEDRIAVAGEPFSQWVIEDNFAAGRPDWAAAGATFTSDVMPWEHLKLRTLNGVHSALAYLGALSGRDTIASALTLDGMTGLLRHYVDTEVRASLVPPEGVDVLKYGDSVLDRFANPQLGHRTLQVAMDGTQKLPQRLLAVLNTVPEPRLATLIAAAWASFAASDLPMDDPLADRVRADLSTQALFGPQGVLPVPDDGRRAMIDSWRREISQFGAAAVVRSAAKS
jgi:fructuronate reductase